MTRVIELIIPNMAEYFLRNPAVQLSGPHFEEIVRFGGTYETEHAVFWSTADRVLILPEGTNPLWFSDVHAALDIEAPPVVSPRRKSGLLVRDLLDDGQAQAALRALFAGRDVVRLVYNGPTPDIYRLASVIEGWGLRPEIDGVPERDYWASIYLDSKVSVLDLAREIPDIRVAHGMSVSNESELRGAVDAMLDRHGKIIARSLYGVAGEGSAVATKGETSLESFYQTLERDSFFRSFPLVVQRFIPHGADVGCPAADILVGPDGVEEIVLCALTVEHGHMFRSVNVGQGALPPVWAERLSNVARQLGEAARRLGYRGWMCCDCVAGSDDTLYVTEINARRSGSQHAGSLLRMWKAQGELTLSAHFMVDVPAGSTYEKTVRPVFEPLWKAGVKAYPTTIRGMAWDDPIIAVIAAGATAREAEDIVAGIKLALGA
jgi:hypothetical protein